MMEGFEIRDYRHDDYDKVIRLWEETGMGSPERGDDRETIERCMRNGGRMLILEDRAEKTITGTSWMTFDGRRIHLHHFGILPSYQGRGLAKTLLQRSLKHVKEEGCQVKIEVHASNTPAIKLYQKYGFEYLGDYRVYIIRNTDEIKYDSS